MIVVAKLKAKIGKEGEMEKAMRNMVSKVEKKEEDTLVYTMHRSRKDPTVFLFYEKFKDKEAFRFHSSTPDIKELFDTLDPLLDGKPEIEMYEEVLGIKR